MVIRTLTQSHGVAGRTFRILQLSGFQNELLKRSVFAACHVTRIESPASVVGRGGRGSWRVGEDVPGLKPSAGPGPGRWLCMATFIDRQIAGHSGCDTKGPSPPAIAASRAPLSAICPSAARPPCLSEGAHRP